MMQSIGSSGGKRRRIPGSLVISQLSDGRPPVVSPDALPKVSTPTACCRTGMKVSRPLGSRSADHQRSLNGIAFRSATSHLEY